MDVDAIEGQVTAARGRIGRAWVAAMTRLRETNSPDAIERRLHTITPLSGIDVAAKYIAGEEFAAYIAAGQAAARYASVAIERVSKRVGFDAADPPAVAWAAANQLQLIRQLTEDQRRMVHQVLLDAGRAGINPRAIAARIAAYIGLTSKQAAAVDSYRAALEHGQYTAALQREMSSGLSNKAIAAAVRRDTSLTSEQIDTAVERLRANAVQARGLTIARTEGLRVAHQGSDELYRQAVSRGDISGDQIEREWIHRSGVKGKEDRWFHKQMEVGKVGYDERFVSGKGRELAHPGDPAADPDETINCTCVVTTRLRRRPSR